MRTPMPMTVIRRGRYVAGALAAAGAIAFFHFSDGVAEAQPLKQPSTRSAAARPPVDAVVSSVVKPGESLSVIAKRNGVSVSSLVAINGIKNPDFIVAGTPILIPSSGQTVAKTGQAPAKVNAKTAPKASASFGYAAPKASPGGPLPDELKTNPQRAALQKHFQSAAQQHGVPSDLLQAMTWQESGWQNKVTSNVGAQGVGQLMPDTVTFVNSDLLKKPLDPSKPEQNINMSAAYLRYLLDQTDGDSRMALAAYYQGLNALRTKGVYNDTQLYVRNVLALQSRYF